MIVPLWSHPDVEDLPPRQDAMQPPSFRRGSSAPMRHRQAIRAVQAEHPERTRHERGGRCLLCREAPHAGECPRLIRARERRVRRAVKRTEDAWWSLLSYVSDHARPPSAQQKAVVEQASQARTAARKAAGLAVYNPDFGNNFHYVTWTPHYPTPGET